MPRNGLRRNEDPLMNNLRSPAHAQPLCAAPAVVPRQHCCWRSPPAAASGTSQSTPSGEPPGRHRRPGARGQRGRRAAAPGIDQGFTKVLRVAIPTNEPPTQFYREGTQDMTGTNPDIARLIGEALGVKVEIQVANFDSIIPGMAAGRYDMTVSSMTPTEKRMEVLDFVDYMQMGNAIAVPKGNPPGITVTRIPVRQEGWPADRLLPADRQRPRLRQGLRGGRQGSDPDAASSRTPGRPSPR